MKHIEKQENEEEEEEVVTSKNFFKVEKCTSKIKEINVVGDVLIEFSDTIYNKYVNISHINSTIMDIYI